MGDTGRGWVGSLTGGESPHVGGVVLAVPRVSLSGSDAASCDIYSVPVPGHLDNEMGRFVADLLCRATGSVVSLSSGIHIDHAEPGELDDIRKNCLAAVTEFLDFLYR